MAHRIDCSCPENRTVPTTGHHRSTGITVRTVLVFNYVLNPHSQIRQLFEILPNFMVTTMYFINIWDNNQIGNMVLPNSLLWNKSILLQLSKPKHSSSQIKNIILKLNKIDIILTITKEGFQIDAGSGAPSNETRNIFEGAMEQGKLKT